MTFLNPAILFGLFAAAIPLALHFLNLRKLKKIEFSTLAFLKELQKTKIKRIKLKQWLLLLLRIAIIILLVMAFARPTVKSFSVDNSAVAKTTAVIIIDNTFSMSVVNEKGSYLNRSKQIAKSLLGNFQDGDEILLLPVGELQYEVLKQAKKIDEIQISFVSKTLDEAIVKAAQVLHQSKNFNKEIYLFTDLQKGRVFNSTSSFIGTSLSGILNNNTRFYLIDVAGKEAMNLGVEELKTDNQIFEKGKTVSFTTRVKNYSNQNVNNSVVSLFVAGKRSAQQSLNLTAGETKEISFETTLADTGLVEVFAELEDDDILQDNKRFFAFYVPDKISLLILTDNRDDAKFVKLALENHSQQKIRIAEYGPSQLPSLNLKNYDLVFVIGSEKIFEMPVRQINWNNLTNYIERGGKVIVMPGSQNTLQSFQKLCNAIGAAAPTTSVGKRNSLESPSLFDRVDFQNPLFADLFENKKEPQIESPEVYYYLKIVPGSKGKSIISMFDNSAFLSEYKIGSGKVFLFNSAPVLSWNNFPMKGFFSALLNKMLLYSASKVKDENTFVAGQEITADISNHSVSQIRIEKPGGVDEYINSDSLLNPNFFSYNRTDETGTYKFFSGGKLMDYISVNHDSHESVTEKSSESEFEDYLKQIGFDGKLYTLSLDDNFSRVIYQSRFGTELWKYFLTAVLLLAIVESLVARSSKKDLISS